MSALDKILEHAVANGLNVLFTGKHGVGKTMKVKRHFEAAGLNWKYFSTATLDPYLDLIGVPKEVDGKLELIRPAHLDFDNIEAIFLDEYNRSVKRIRNAVMELIQFGSINGAKFPKLRLIWAAVNPDDDEDLAYDVEKLDPAQKDRFDLHVPIKYEVDAYYFSNAWGPVGKLAVKWWQDQTTKVKAVVSPRRLEIALKVHQCKGDVRYVFDPKIVHVGEFVEFISKEDPTVILDRLATPLETDPNDKKAEAAVRKFFKDTNNLKHVRTDLVSKERYLKYLIHLLPESELMKELRSDRGTALISHIINDVPRFEYIVPLVLANPKVYSGQVVSAFTTYNQSKGVVTTPASKNRKVVINGVETNLSSMHVCFTGTITGYTRKEAKEFLEPYGVIIHDNVTFDVTHVITGTKPGKGKLSEGKKRNVIFVDTKGFFDIIQTLSGGSSRLINDRTIDIDQLTLDNYLMETGVRFRRTKWDKDNDVTRSAAFRTHIDNLRQNAPVV